MKLLLVEDDRDFRALLADTLARQGLEVVQAEGRRDALRAVALGGVDAVLCDRHLADGSGDELARLFGATLPFVFLTGGRVDDGGVHRCLRKPASVDLILSALSAATGVERRA